MQKLGESIEREKDEDIKIERRMENIVMVIENSMDY
jgi:hypothetical protein